MRPAIPSLCAAMLVACVPEYRPGSDAATDGTTDQVVCDPPLPVLPDGIVPLRTATGYDHGGGVSGDGGVIHHEAFVVDGPDSFTMLSFQDFRGSEAVRSAGSCVAWTDPVCGYPQAGPVCDHAETIPADSYVDMPVAVLFLVGCPYESMGGCERQFMAASGTATFTAFEKPEDSWHLDTLARLGLRLESLVFREVQIDPVSFESVFTCSNCSQSFTFAPYELDWSAP